MAGKSGPWNYLMFIAICLCSLTSPFQNISYQFLGFTPDYWCHVDALVEANWTAEQILDVAIPKKPDGRPEGCINYDFDFEKAASLGYDAVKENLNLISDGTNRTITCPRRDFNYTQYASTIVTEWDLVCDRRYLYSSTQAGAQAGKLLGFIFGYLSDTFGRRHVVLVSSLLYIITGFLASSSVTIELYILCRILVSLFGMGFYLPCFVLSLELCTPSQRSYVGSFFAIPWAFGYMAIPGIAYYVREWKALQAALTAPSLVLLIYFWMLPESPRWLVLKGRFQEALAVLKKAAAMNSRVLPSDEKMLSIMKRIKEKDAPEENVDEERRKSWLDVIKTSATLFLQLFSSVRVALQTLIVFFCWFSVSFVYYGVALNSFSIGANTYWYTFFSGLLEIPSYLLLWPATALAGRKKTLIGLYALCAIAIFGSIGARDHIGWAAALSLAGKFAITAAFQVAYLFTAELYQTGTRTVAVGTSSIMARCGSIITPYINDLIGENNPSVPSIMFGTASCFAAVSVLFLSETNKQNLAETVAGADIAPFKKSTSLNPIIEPSEENTTSLEPSVAVQAK